MQASCVRLTTLSISAAVLPMALSFLFSRCAASTAVCEWNSARVKS
jgi:hypothetical protein